MNISILSTFYPYRGGIAQFNANLFRELEKEHTVRAFTFTRQYPDLLFPGSTQFVGENDQADAIPAKRVMDTVNPFSYIKTARLIKAAKPDVLITNFWMPFFAPSIGWVSRSLQNSGCRVISILHNLIPHEPRPGDTALIRYFVKRNDAFLAMSAAVKDELLSVRPDAKCTVKAHPVYDHFDPKIARKEAIRKLNLPEDKKLLLFFGFIRDYKGLDYVLRALVDLDDTYHLVIAGEVYGSFEKYDALINALNISDRVHLFTRYIDDKEVPLFFSAADVAVLPYKSATQSGIVQMAYHFDLPVIVTNVGGLSEMVTDGETGLIVESGEATLIAEKIEYYFEQDLRNKMSKEIQEKKQTMSWQGFAQTVSGICAQLQF